MRLIFLLSSMRIEMCREGKEKDEQEISKRTSLVSLFNICLLIFLRSFLNFRIIVGDVAHMVECSLSIPEERGSKPFFANLPVKSRVLLTILLFTQISLI